MLVNIRGPSRKFLKGNIKETTGLKLPGQNLPGDGSQQKKMKPPDLDGLMVSSVFKLSESWALPHGQQHFLPLSELAH